MPLARDLPADRHICLVKEKTDFSRDIKVKITAAVSISILCFNMRVVTYLVPGTPGWFEGLTTSWEGQQRRGFVVCEVRYFYC